MRDAVIAAIDGQVDFRNYSRILIVTPGNGACTWAGTANVGCRAMSSNGDGEFTASVAWQRAESMATRTAAVQLTTHELGHNLTLSHAGSRDFGSEALGAIGAAGTLSEYGDPFSTMGSWNFGFYAASQAANQLQWLGAGSNYTVVETSGTYTIQGYETRPAGVKALKVRRGTGNNSWLWLESRQNVGNYSSRLDPSAFRGALVHFEDATTGNDSHLLDFTTGNHGVQRRTIARRQQLDRSVQQPERHREQRVGRRHDGHRQLRQRDVHGCGADRDAVSGRGIGRAGRHHAARPHRQEQQHAGLRSRVLRDHGCCARRLDGKPRRSVPHAGPRPAIADVDQRRRASGLRAGHLRRVGVRA